jgi:hypothetical protein
LSIGTQILRSYNYDKSFIYTPQSGVHFFWVISCLSKKYGCGSRDMEVFRTLNERVQNEVNKIENPNLSQINKIRINIGKNFMLSEMEKGKLAFAALVSYAKLIFHSTFIEIFGAFKINASPLYFSGENNFFSKILHVSSNMLNNKFSGLYVVSVLVIILLRFLQVFGFYLTLQSVHLRMYGLIIMSIIFIILATGVGLGNPRYRSEAEPLLIIFSAIGIKSIIDKSKR